MKSFLIIFLMVAFLFSCAKKMTPSPQPAAVNQVKPPENTPKEAAAKMESPQVTAGKNIYTTKCARCHGPKDADRWTVQEWIPILERMVPTARLDATEKANVTAYVNFYAKGSN